MDAKQYLNYTHGNMLQSLCHQILSGPSTDSRGYLKWISNEKGRLRRQQPEAWS